MGVSAVFAASCPEYP
ncbi:hypothetical protein YPPY14_4372, partial [Yersinia pestis PY-14]